MSTIARSPSQGETVDFERIGERDWRKLANDAALDPTRVVDTVHQVARDLPDALHQARRDANTHDENRNQRQVDERASAIHAFIAQQNARLKADTRRKSRRVQRPKDTPDPGR